jgi:hypothetical protein
MWIKGDFHTIDFTFKYRPACGIVEIGCIPGAWFIVLCVWRILLRPLPLVPCRT